MIKEGENNISFFVQFCAYAEHNLQFKCMLPTVSMYCVSYLPFFHLQGKIAIHFCQRIKRNQFSWNEVLQFQGI